MLTCPVCGGDTDVVFTTNFEEGVRRNRTCRDCGYKFRTLEFDEDILVKAGFTVKKKRGRKKNNE